MGVTVTPEQLRAASKALGFTFTRAVLELVEANPQATDLVSLTAVFESRKPPLKVTEEDIANLLAVIQSIQAEEEPDASAAPEIAEPIDLEELPALVEPEVTAVEEAPVELVSDEFAPEMEAEAEVAPEPEPEPEAEVAPEPEPEPEPEPLEPAYDIYEFLNVDYRNLSFKNQEVRVSGVASAISASWLMHENPEAIYVLASSPNEYPLQLDPSSYRRITKFNATDLVSSDSYFSVFVFASPGQQGVLWARGRRVPELSNFTVTPGNGLVTLSWSAPPVGTTLRIAKSLSDTKLPDLPTADMFMSLPASSTYLLDRNIELGKTYEYRAFLEWLTDDGIVRSTSGLTISTALGANLPTIERLEVIEDPEIPGLLSINYSLPNDYVQVKICQLNGLGTLKLNAAIEQQAEFSVDELFSPEGQAWLGVPLQGELSSRSKSQTLNIYRSPEEFETVTFVAITVLGNRARVCAQAPWQHVGDIQAAKLIDRLDYQIIRVNQPDGAQSLDLWIVAPGVPFDQIEQTRPSRTVLIADEYRRFGGVMFADNIPDRPQVRRLSAQPQTIYIRGRSAFGSDTKFGDVIKVEYPGRLEIRYRQVPIVAEKKVEAKKGFWRRKKPVEQLAEPEVLKKAEEPSQPEQTLQPEPGVQPAQTAPQVPDLFEEGASIKKTFASALQQVRSEDGVGQIVEAPLVEDVAQSSNQILTAEANAVTATGVQAGDEKRPWWKFWKPRNKRFAKKVEATKPPKNLQILISGIIGPSRPTRVSLLHFASDIYPLDEYTDGLGKAPIDIAVADYTETWKTPSKVVPKQGEPAPKYLLEGELEHRLQVQTSSVQDTINGLPCFTIDAGFEAKKTQALNLDLDLKVAVVGGRNSGKTVYINALINYLEQQYSLLIESNFRVAEGDAAEASKARQLAIREMLKQGELPDVNPAGQPAQTFRYTYRSLTPVPLRSITIHDVAGADAESAESLMAHKEVLAAADLIIFMLDPFQNSAIHESMRGSLNLADDIADADDPFELLDNLAQVVKADGTGRNANQRVAFMLSKFDGIEAASNTAGTLIYNVIRKGMAISRDGMSLSRDTYSESEGQLVSKETKALLARLSRTGPLLRLIKDSFSASEQQFFVSSALGHTRFSRNLDSSGLTSYRVFDPIRWVIAERQAKLQGDPKTAPATPKQRPSQTA